MIKQTSPQPEILSVLIGHKLSHTLIDKRRQSFGLRFGKIGDVARQYGITLEAVGSYWKCSAPKSRLQMFVEKLHFSGVPYLPENNNEKSKSKPNKNSKRHQSQS